jgi:CTP:molybdopterin cytidylyltransferase MocA
MVVASLWVGGDMSPAPEAGCCDATCTTGRLRVAGIVLAAGEGRRLGCRPKGLIKVSGETLLARNVRVLFEAGVDEVVVVTGHYSEQLEAVLADLPVRQICQPDVTHSQRDSLCLGLAELPADCDAVLVMPVDMPSLTREDLVALIAAYKHAAPEITFIGPAVAGRPGNPVVFSRDVAGRIMQGEGDFGSGAWRSQAQAWRLEWETDNPHYVTDIDTPEDLDRWQSASQDP